MSDQTTCTCNILKPLRTSTPNCSQRSLEDCCPDVFIIKHECPQSPLQISQECCDPDEQVILQCTASCSSSSIHSEPNMIRPHETQHQLNSTYELTSKASCEKSKTGLPTKTCPSTVDLAKEWLSCKTCELKHKIEDLIYSQPKPCEIKHVDFTDSCEFRCKHDRDPSPCQSAKSRSQPTDISCENNPNTSHADKSLNYVETAGKLCELCKHVLDPAPSQPVKPCRHVDISGKLCEHCKHLLDSTPCRPENLCKYCAVADKFCNRCKHILVSTSSQPAKSLSYIDIAEKLCGLCKHILDPAPGQPVKTCRHIAEKFGQNCKSVLDSVQCKSDTPCRHCDVTSKLCKQCKPVLDSTPCQSDEPSKFVDIADKPCELCEPALDAVPCQPEDSRKHCDVTSTKKLCQKDSAPCPPIKSCLKHVKIPCKCKLGPTPCKPANSCKYCDISNKLCKGCRRIFDSAPCADRTCKNIDLANKLCEHCRHIYESAPCQSLTSWMKNIEVTDELCDECDISKSLCKECKYIFDSIPCADRSCNNLNIAKKLCEPCRHIYDTAVCQSISSCSKHVEIPDESCEQSMPGPDPCKPVTLCKHCDITKKLCEGCKHVCDSIPCADKSCKNHDITNKLCEHCKHIFASAPCQLEESSKQSVDESCERCNNIPDSVLCQSLKTCKHIHVQVPEKREECKTFLELFFNDQAAGCSSADLWKCDKCACALESQSAATLTPLGPIIKQEAKSTCFDIEKESICRSRGSSPESPDGSCASARARYYQNKLLATLQILQNKEETVRVQAESIAVAESRIAALNARHTDLRREIDRKEREIQGLHKNLKECKKCKVHTFDVSITTDIQEMDDQKNILTTLQNNLDVIEDLYRECFYESVKQENLIELLRKSYLDVRLMDKEKSDRISELHNVVNTQKWSLDRCQDIATEVDSLKMEISNFINSSNNDSGMWEESVVSGLNEDLQDIAAQLLTLRDLLTGDCSCGLEQDNARLRKEKECFEGEISSLRAHISVLEENLAKKECPLDRECQEQIEIKERELKCIREQLLAMMENMKEKSERCDTLTHQFTQTKAMLDDNTTELFCMQKQCRIYEETIKVMKEELGKSEEITKENASLHKELCCVSRGAARVQRRAAELEAELTRARAHCAQIDAAFREKTSNALELERQLDEAHARGAELCGEAGRVVRAVRCWANRMRDMHREQENQIKQKERKLRCLQNELHKRQLSMCPRVWQQIEQASAARTSVSAPSTSGSCSNSTSTNESSCPTVTFCMADRRHDGTGSSGSEIVCSSTPVPPCEAESPSCSANIPSCSAMPSRLESVQASSANVPPCVPKRTCKKKLSACGLKRRYGWLGPFGAGPQRDASAQHPARCDAASHGTCGTCAHCHRSLPDSTSHLTLVSPGEEMFSRMESLSAALADGYRRWTRRAPT